MIKVTITDNAKLDLVDIIAYISLDNPSRAKSYTKQLIGKATKQISHFPLSCPLYNKTKGIRRFVYENYNLYYSLDTKKETAYILYIMNSATFRNALI